MTACINLYADTLPKGGLLKKFPLDPRQCESLGRLQAWIGSRSQAPQSGEKGESSMMTRDAYVKKLKEQLDRWNAEIGKLEARSKEPMVQLKEAYARQLKELRDQRTELQRQMAEMQKASEQAWTHLQAGAEKAWKALDASFKKAWSDFK